MKNNYSRNLGFVLMGIGLLLLAIGIYGLMRPDEYGARAVIRQGKPVSSNGNLEAHDPRLIQLEIEAIVSEVILSNVVTRLDLGSKWGTKLTMAETVSRLYGRLNVRPRNKVLVEICAVSEDASEAAMIANTVAGVYRDWRREKGMKFLAASDTAIVELAIPPPTPMRGTKLLGALLVVTGLVCLGWGLKLAQDPRASIS